MNVSWESLLYVLPAWIREDVNRLEKDELQEIRLRLQRPPEFILKEERIWLKQAVCQEDISFSINAASRYSPWCTASVKEGYLTVKGGHRIGICGEVTPKKGGNLICNPRSLCIRVARDIRGCGNKAAELPGSVLILGAPGWGKTTLLRDLIRLRGQKETVAVADERGELFPEGFDSGLQTDVLTGCSKAQGILQLLKTMGPQTIAVDEITSPDDCKALGQASFCGVSLLATAHAASFIEFSKRTLYKELLEQKIFDYALILKKDQTYDVERINR